MSYLQDWLRFQIVETLYSSLMSPYVLALIAVGLLLCVWFIYAIKEFCFRWYVMLPISGLLLAAVFFSLERKDTLSEDAESQRVACRTVLVKDVSEEGLVYGNVFRKRISLTGCVPPKSEELSYGKYEELVRGLCVDKEVQLYYIRGYDGYIVYTPGQVELNRLLLASGMVYGADKVPNSYKQLISTAKSSRLGVYSTSEGMLSGWIFKWIVSMIITSILTVLTSFMRKLTLKD